jgi:hypothetical protein
MRLLPLLRLSMLLLLLGLRGCFLACIARLAVLRATGLLFTGVLLIAALVATLIACLLIAHLECSLSA